MRREANKIKRERGITLVALVVTIVIIVILSSVTLVATFGENGIIKKAELARDLASNSIAKENEDMNSLMDEYSNVMNDDGEIPEPPVDITPPTVSIVVGEVTETSIAVTVNAEDKESGLAEEDTYKYYINGEVEPRETSTNNSYTFTGLTAETEYTIKVEAFDKAGNKGESSTKASTKKKENPTDGSYNEEKGVNSPKLGQNMKLVKFDESSQEWVEGIEYSYIGKTTTGDNNESKWANAEVTTNGVKSYFVWIPRYAYKINENNKTIDVKFIKNTGNIASDGTICKYVRENPGENDYIIHPAFTNDVNNGGWNSELSGIWIGKYETSGDSSQLIVQPGQKSFENVTIGDAYTYAKKYSTELKSHMIKNSEWGITSYLSYSKYGRNGIEISTNINPDYTGGGTDKSYVTNIKQSSTGNIYGIYDLSGGAGEYVATYYNQSYNLTNGKSFASIGGISNEYSTVYDNTEINRGYKYGDATYETEQWNSDGARFINSSNPFFERGSYFFGASYTGVFCFFDCNR